MDERDPDWPACEGRHVVSMDVDEPAHFWLSCDGEPFAETLTTENEWLPWVRHEMQQHEIAVLRRKVEQLRAATR